MLFKVSTLEFRVCCLLSQRAVPAHVNALCGRPWLFCLYDHPYGRLSASDRTSSTIPHFPRLLPFQPAMSLSSLLLDSSKSAHAAIDKGLDDLFKSNTTVCDEMRKL